MSAALIAVGVLVPLDVPGTDVANFLGYVIWSMWLLVFALLIWRRRNRVLSRRRLDGPQSVTTASM